MEFLGGLPTELTCAIITEWLEVREVGQLDSACVGHISRHSLLAAYASPQCVLVGWPKLQQSNEYMQWICRKKIRVENVIITPSTTFPLIVGHLKTLGSFVRRIKACQITFSSNECANLFRCVVFYCMWCEGLTTLCCDRSELNDSIFDVLRFCPLIQHLYFTRCVRNIDSEVDERRCADLKHVKLRSLTASKCTMVDKCLYAVLTSVAPHSIERVAVPNLRYVYRRHPQQFTHLRAVSIDRVTRFGSDGSLAHLARTSPHTAHLDLRFTRPANAQDVMDQNTFRNMRELRSVNFVQSHNTHAFLRAVQSLAITRHSSMEQLYFEHMVHVEPQATLMREAYQSLLPNCPNICTLSALETTTVPVQSPSALFRAFVHLVSALAPDGADLSAPCFQHLQHLRCSVDLTTFKAFDFTLLTAQRLPALRTLVLVLIGNLLSVNPTIALLQAARPELHITRDASVLEYSFMKLSLE